MNSELGPERWPRKQQSGHRPHGTPHTWGGGDGPGAWLPCCERLFCTCKIPGARAEIIGRQVFYCFSRCLFPVSNPTFSHDSLPVVSARSSLLDPCDLSPRGRPDLVCRPGQLAPSWRGSHTTRVGEGPWTELLLHVTFLHKHYSLILMNP